MNEVTHIQVNPDLIDNTHAEDVKKGKYDICEIISISEEDKTITVVSKFFKEPQVISYAYSPKEIHAVIAKAPNKVVLINKEADSIITILDP